MLKNFNEEYSKTKKSDKEGVKILFFVTDRYKLSFKREICKKFLNKKRENSHN